MNQNQEIKNIPFEGGELLGIKDKDAQVWLAVRKVCIDIGLTPYQADRQVKNIQADIVLSQGSSNLTILTNGGKQNVIAIKEDFVTLWLAKISLTPAMQKKSPEAVRKLVSYQLKAQKALHEAFTATEEKKSEFYNSLGIEGRIEELNETIDELTYEVNDLTEKFDEVNAAIATLIENQTINSRQAQKLLELAKCRVKDLLGGSVDAPEYKENARKYFKRLWGNLANAFQTNTYKDLNPVNFEEAKVFVSTWCILDNMY